MGSFWEEFKDLFKTDQEKIEEKEDEVSQVLEDEKSVIEELKKLQEEYTATLPKKEHYNIGELFPVDSGLKEIEYTPRTDEEIENSAKLEIEGKKYGAISDIESRYQEAQKALQDNKIEAGETLKDSYANLQKLYNELGEKVKDESLKRGLARSSIVTSQLNDLNKAHIDSASAQEREYLKSVNDINYNISKLEMDRENALDRLDVEYAVELDNRITELKDERAKTIKQYEDYNNDIRQQKIEYEQNRVKDIEEFLHDNYQRELEKIEAENKYEKEYGYSGAKLENYSKRYDIAYDFYKSLSPDIAVAALQASPNMKYYLGNMYDKLLSTLKSYMKSDSKKTYY